MSNSKQALDRRHIREAAQWLARLSADRVTDAERRAWERWHSQGPEQQQAWALARSVSSKFESVPENLDTSAVVGEVRPTRRQTLKALSVLALAPPAAWMLSQLSWHAWAAEYKTATGERQTITLDDGTRVVMNTASALDVDFDPARRLVRLWTGEVMVTPARERSSSDRPLVVRTEQGEIWAAAARFAVRIAQGSITRALALDGPLEISPAGMASRVSLGMGQQAAFTRSEVTERAAIAPNSDLWTDGLLYAADMPLASLVAELARYRPGVLQCDPAVGGIPVSGMFQLNDTDHVLALLERSYPVSVRKVVAGWTIVEPR